ncbi:MAG: hypothetical protein CL524_03580 [Aequorivita sp.]|nr:hypothetical protein [Aequorivita sp.]
MSGRSSSTGHSTRGPDRQPVSIGRQGRAVSKFIVGSLSLKGLASLRPLIPVPRKYAHISR